MLSNLVKRIRVLVVDDSAVVRRLVTEALSADPEIEVVGTASDPFMARDKILALSPDVLTLDLEMPRMDGLTFLDILMRERPIPTVVMSSLTKENSVYALEALRLGAVDVLGKPGGSYSFGDLGPRLVQAVKAAARARLRRGGPVLSVGGSVAVSPGGAVAGASVGSSASRSSLAHSVAMASAATAPARLPAPAGPVDPRRIIMLGASTGGTEALREVLVRLPDGLPPIAIVQHIPAHFSRAFAERLDTLCAFDVHEAQDGEVIRAGVAVVAPGNFHLMLKPAAGGYRVELNSGPQVWHQRPAVDVMFKSLPEPLAPYAVAAVFTGMGKDGAEGLLRLRRAGARTFAQDEATSVVYGMPREAWENGGAEFQCPLESAAEHIVRLATLPVARAANV